jgi:hypothetical protein
MDNKLSLQKARAPIRQAQNFLNEEGIKLYRQLMFFEKHLPPNKRTQVNMLLGIHQNETTLLKKIGKALVYVGSIVNTSGSSTYDKFKQGIHNSENPK